MNLLIPSAIDKIVTLLFFEKDGFGIAWPSKVDVINKGTQV